MTHPKRNTMINRTALLLSLFIVHGVAFAAPPSKNNDDIKISTDRGQISLDWDDKEYDWWQNNCLNIRVIPPFLGAFKSRGHAACARRCFGV